MKKQDVLKLSSMPLQSPTYPVGPYKFFERQYMIINYRTDPAMPSFLQATRWAFASWPRLGFCRKRSC